MVGRRIRKDNVYKTSYICYKVICPNESMLIYYHYLLYFQKLIHFLYQNLEGRNERNLVAVFISFLISVTNSFTPEICFHE